uniref:Nonsense-mediated mRNA decay factor SMG8 n=2 Tax=Mesocestoides corti TaxID=53468 RepID=A0A5K3FFB8_MESCO
MSTYCGGRFAVPPGFDFRLLPQKSKSVVVVSIIGFFDSFRQMTSSSLVENFLNRNAFSLPCTDSLIQGYYDCEHQLVFLHFRDSEQLLSSLLEKSDNIECVLEKWDTEKLKNLYFLFLVSHFIIVVTYGTSLDTRYIACFKLISRLRRQLSHTVESLLKTLPLPRYCISVGRIATPRLLFVFKLPATIASRKLSEDPNSLLAFERNLTGQIFNGFHESGLLEGNSSENRLFDLMGYSYVRVLPPDLIEPLNQHTEHHGHSDKGHLAQQLLESLLLATGIPSLLEGSDIIKNQSATPHSPLYPPPDRPDDCSFPAFLQCHLTSFLDDPVFRNQSESHTHHSFELPSCKSWFIACYKLYSSLMNDEEPASTSSATKVAGGSKVFEGNSDSSLSRHWHKLFHSATDNTNVDAAAAKPTAVTLLATESQLDQRLSSTRSEAALSAAEAHYRQDLPSHYSRTYHLAKVVSSYNVFLRLARGRCVILALDRLTRRLARLYLAGRVGCPALLVSGAICRQELHRIPDRFPCIANAFRALKDKRKSMDEYSTANFASLINTACDAGNIASRSTKIAHLHETTLSDCLQDVPHGVVGQWRCAWIEAVLKILEKQEDHQEPSGEPPCEDSTALQHLSVIPHRSDQRYISYCNCGRTQALRLDPFDYQEANWNFYNSLESACCNKLTTIPLAPLFLNALGHNFCIEHGGANVTGKVQASQLEVEFSDLALGNSRQPLSGNDMVEDEQFTDGTDLRDAEEETFLDARESDSYESSASAEVSGLNSFKDGTTGSVSQDSDQFLPVKTRCETKAASNASDDDELAKEHTNVRDVKVASSRQEIAVSFVQGMPVLGQPAGTLPLYPSWAIHALGKYFSYSHSSGMSHPGFLRGSNFLLPWDVQLSRSSVSVASKHRGGRQRDFDTIKLFLGFEMECPLGHRFFLAGPDRPMTGLMQGCDVRRAVSSLLACDLPLYLPCRCSPASANVNDDRVDSGSEVIWSQLMRIFVALPSAPVRIRFGPRIRPGPVESNTPIFHLGPTLDQQLDVGNSEVRNLQHENRSHKDSGDSFSGSSDEGTHRVCWTKSRSRNGVKSEPGYVYLDNGLLWVARLPFAYQNENTVYRRPQDPKHIDECRLLRGSLVMEEL